MATRQNRLPGVKWSEYSDRPPRKRQQPRPEPLSGDPNPALQQQETPGVPGGNPNVSGSQFNKAKVQNALVGLAERHATSQYFRHAGFGAALRYTIGLRQLPSHMTDYINSQTRGQKQTGINPNPAYIAPDPYKPWHSISEPET